MPNQHRLPPEQEAYFKVLDALGTLPTESIRDAAHRLLRTNPLDVMRPVALGVVSVPDNDPGWHMLLRLSTTIDRIEMREAN